MKASCNTILFCLLLISLIACKPKFAHKEYSYFNIDEISVFPFNVLPEDTIIGCHFYSDSIYLANCHQFDMVNSIDTLQQMGIRMRFLSDKRVNLNYGPFTEGGLVKKCKRIEVTLSNELQKLDITPYLYGDSILSNKYEWRTYFNHPKIHTIGSIDNCCYRATYIAKIDSLISYLNNSIDQFDDADILLFIDKQAYKKLIFNPTKLLLKAYFVSTPNDTVTTECSYILK